MSILYTIKRHTHGWLICAAPGQRGIPMNAVDECMPLFPGHSGGAVFDAGIAHHYNISRFLPPVVVAVATPAGAKAWREEIIASLAHLVEPCARWWQGVDTGTSSAVIFSVLCPSTATEMRVAAKVYGNGSTPLDADDLGRCLRLIALFPEWRDRLDEVAAAYPDTAWPRIVDRWDELEKADAKTQCYILNECRTPKAGGR